jgi:GNAT superfamily N-acetyltransferase
MSTNEPQRHDPGPLEIIDADPTLPDAVGLLVSLSRELQQITGCDGTANFKAADVSHARSAFVLARSEREAVGCGCIRPLTEDVCELKRMYSKYRDRGIGRRLLFALEERARRLGYTSIWLETRKVNQRAVDFYTRWGYRVRDNFGPYVGRDEAVCFEKQI